jgi:hypothetical protein
MSRGPIVLHVERLVIDGAALTPAQGVRLRASLERELVRLLSHAELGTDGRSASGVAPRGVSWDASRPEQLGRNLARSVCASLGGVLPDAVSGSER